MAPGTDEPILMKSDATCRKSGLPAFSWGELVLTQSELVFTPRRGPLGLPMGVGKSRTLSIPLDEIENVRKYRIGGGHGIEVKYAGKTYKFHVGKGIFLWRIFLWNSGKTAKEWLAVLEERRTSSLAGRTDPSV